MKYCAAVMLFFCGLFLWVSADAMIACNQTYALCDTSPCVPIPGMKDKSICFCSVFSDYSIGNLTCKQRAPFTDKHNIQHLYSNYGWSNAKIHKLMTCPAGTPWTFCLDKQCIVDPRNPNNAICTCDIKTAQKYVTFAGNCDTTTCGNTLYSAATVSDIDQGNSLLMKVLNMTTPLPENCPMKASQQS